MMKQLLSKCFSMIIASWLSTVVAYATTVEVESNSNSGINNANYTATLENGSVLGFFRYYSSYDFQFCGVITTDSSLVVPDSIMYGANVYPVATVTSCDVSKSPNLTGITAPSATSIGENAFSGCSSLTSVSLPSATSIEDYAFRSCSSLTSVSLPSATSIGYYAFYNCSSLTSVSLPSATSIEYYAFQNCSSLTSVSLPSATSIGSNAFSGCSSLTSVSLPSTLTFSSNWSLPSKGLNLYLLGNTVATWSPSDLPRTCTVWVDKDLYDDYKPWISNYGVDVRYEGWEPYTVNVTVNTAGQLSSLIFSEVEQLTDVEALVVSGHLNSSDMRIIPTLKCARHIDLSQTDITSVGGCTGMGILRRLVLPETVKKVEDNAFQNCYRLDSVSLPVATSIGDYAFDHCSSLTSVSLPSATSIGGYAFYYCSSLTSVSLPSATSIGEYAFAHCSSLTSVSLPSATSIGYEAFEYCRSLTSVSLPSATSIGYDAFYDCDSLTSVSLPSATSIGYGAFYDCSSLTSVSLPSATSIGGRAFYNCSSLTSVSLPASLHSLGEGCFRYSSLADIYCHVVTPFATEAFGDISATTTLHVPAFSTTNYRLHPDWGGKLSNIVPMEGDIDVVTVNADLQVSSLTGLADKATLKVSSWNDSGVSCGHLDVATQTPWQLGRLEFENYQWVEGTRKSWTYPYCNTMIPQTEMSADEVELDFCVQTDEWNFISFPFDVNVADIEWPEGTLWAIRRYSGADRAALTGNTWQDMTTGMTLQAGEGYILQCTDGGGSTGLTLKVHAVDNGKKNNIFAYGDVSQPLALHDSELAHNRSWNLVGNPYPAYYKTSLLTHNGVITTWNGSGYTAYSLLDDQYVLHPFEAFFVQRSDAEAMTFAAAGRSHSPEEDEDAGARNAVGTNDRDERSVYNLSLANPQHSDRTRLVVNPQASAAYETSRDASKMIGSQQPVALYILDGGVRYAIDERPLGSGVFQLGMRTSETGRHTLQLDGHTTDGTSVVLTDHKTGQQTDLTLGAYSFTASAGSDDSRFTLTLGGEISGINAVEDATRLTDKCYNLSGQRITKEQMKKGVYVVNGRKVVATE